jgi:hypothetical protein
MFMARVTEQAGHSPADDGNPAGQLWPAIVGAMLAEVRHGATQQQAHGFFTAVGLRIAALLPMDGIEDLDALTQRVNVLWAQLGWGGVAMTMVEDGIDLHHGGVPHMPSIGDDGQWLSAVGSILEGAYDGWFRSLGSGAHFRTRVIRQSDDGFDLRHAA